MFIAKKCEDNKTKWEKEIQTNADCIPIQSDKKNISMQNNWHNEYLFGVEDFHVVPDSFFYGLENNVIKNCTYKNTLNGWKKQKKSNCGLSKRIY